MSFSRVQLQSNRDQFRLDYAVADSRKPMGFLRIISSAVVILFSVFMYYIAMHYIPALANPRKILRLATESSTLPPASNAGDFKEASTLEKLMGPYFKPFVMDRAYMRAGESIKIRYQIPEGTTVRLDIVQCRRIWAIEIFHCDIVSQFTVEKQNPRGISTYALGSPGFYHFRHRIEGLEETETYRLVWERIEAEAGHAVNKTLRPS